MIKKQYKMIQRLIIVSVLLISSSVLGGSSLIESNMLNPSDTLKVVKPDNNYQIEYHWEKVLS